MGKPNAFLTVSRQEPSKEKVEERLKHYREIYKSLSEDQLKEQASRCMNCGVPFCHSFGCPLGNFIPEWNDLVYKGRWREAAERLHLTSNFPEITGRVCPALCEASCVVGVEGHPAVSIRQIELSVVEKAFAEGWVTPRPPEVETGKRVAVVGSGPAGLATAQQLRRAGHEVTVFEKADQPGGILRYGIPDFKLEKWVIDRRLAQLTAEGVDFQCEVEAGRDVSAVYLKRKFDAIGLCGGAMVPRDLTIPGRDAQGIHLALDFLIQQNRRVAGRPVPAGTEISAAGKRVVIIGGGDTGSDCLGTSLRQGAREVEQLEVMPRPPESRDGSTPWPLWPYMLRSSSSHDEGGHRQWCINTRSFTKNVAGVLTGLECVKVEWFTDDKGRFTFKEIPGSEFTIQADLVLLAMGFIQPVHEGLLDDLGVAYDPRGNVKVDDATMMSSVPGVFAAGDMMLGAALVVRAIAAGRRMARRVDQYLMGQSDLPETDIPRVGSYS